MDYLRKNGDMIWIVPFAGNQYGTKRELVDEIFRRKEKCGIMILTPDTVALAKLYVEKRFQGSAFVKSAYICSQRDYVLVERMRGRGESEDNIRRRLIEAEEWKKWEWSFGIFDRFVRNDLEENPPAITAARELEMMIFN
jgi:guanylate kinase